MIDSSGWDPLEVYVRKLDGMPPYGFDCGRHEQNRFLHEFAWEDQTELLSTTYLFYLKGICASYATLFMDSIPLGRHERGLSIRYKSVSALKLGQLGVDSRFQGSGLGKHVVGYAVNVARDESQRVGCRYLTLDAQPDLVQWYEQQGFVRNLLRQDERIQDALRHRRDPEGIAVSMRLDLRRPD